MLLKVFHENVIRSRLELFWKTNRSENFNDNNDDDDDNNNNNNNNNNNYHYYYYYCYYYYYLRLIQAARGDKIDGLEAVSVLKRSKKEKRLEDCEEKVLHGQYLRQTKEVRSDQCWA